MGITQSLKLVPVWWNGQSTSKGGMGRSYYAFAKRTEVVVANNSNIPTVDYDDYRTRLDGLGEVSGGLQANGRKAKNYARVFGDEWELYLKAGTPFDQTVKRFIDEAWDIFLIMTVSAMQGLQSADGSTIGRPLKAIEARKDKKIVVLWSLTG
jgi:hypothetical protein